MTRQLSPDQLARIDALIRQHHAISLMRHGRESACDYVLLNRIRRRQPLLRIAAVVVALLCWLPVVLEFV